MKYAVLIDGGFIRRKLGSPAAPMTLLQVTRFIERLKEHSALSQNVLHRIYWYDAQPLEGTAKRPLKGGHVNFGDTSLARTHRALLRDLGACRSAISP